MSLARLESLIRKNLFFSEFPDVPRIPPIGTGVVSDFQRAKRALLEARIDLLLSPFPKGEVSYFRLFEAFGSYFFFAAISAWEFHPNER